MEIGGLDVGDVVVGGVDLDVFFVVLDDGVVVID